MIKVSSGQSTIDKLARLEVGRVVAVFLEVGHHLLNGRQQILLVLELARVLHVLSRRARGGQRHPSVLGGSRTPRRGTAAAHGHAALSRQPRRRRRAIHLVLGARHAGDHALAGLGQRQLLAACAAVRGGGGCGGHSPRGEGLTSFVHHGCVSRSLGAPSGSTLDGRVKDTNSYVDSRFVRKVDGRGTRSGAWPRP